MKGSSSYACVNHSCVYMNDLCLDKAKELYGGEYISCWDGGEACHCEVYIWHPQVTQEIDGVIEVVERGYNDKLYKEFCMKEYHDCEGW